MPKQSGKKAISRSENMSRIRSKNTSIEILLGKAMWRLGLRYRKNDKTVFGKPDFVFKRKKIAVFCDSEFWHGKYLTEGKYTPKTNTEYWIQKLTKNIERDKKVNEYLESQGWTVVRIWEENIRKDTHSCAVHVQHIFDSLS